MILKKGMSGAEIISFKNTLASKGYGSRVDEFDSELENTVRRFQQEHGLEADGIVGPKTWAKLADNVNTEGLEKRIRDSLVSHMRSKLGERETNGKNRSPYIDKVNNFTGAGLAQPYCLSAIIYSIHEVCGVLGLKCPIPKEASTQAFYNNAPTKYIRPNPIFSKKGDVGIQQTRNDPSRGHAYMLTSDQVTATTHKTVEANTNPQGSRDGDGWYENVRSTEGDSSKRFRGCIDVTAWILDANKGV